MQQEVAMKTADILIYFKSVARQFRFYCADEIKMNACLIGPQNPELEEEMDVLPADRANKPSDMMFPSAAAVPLTYCSSNGGRRQAKT